MSGDSKGGAALERVLIDGESFVVKHVHVDDDWIMRATGDITCRPLLVWQSGLIDCLPACFDTAMVGVAVGLGRNGWGCALLMRDRSDWLVPEGDEEVPLEQHVRFLEHMGDLHAAFWGWEDTVGLLPYSSRWAFFGRHLPIIEAERGTADGVPAISGRGWARFAERAGDVAPLVLSLRDDPSALVGCARPHAVDLHPRRLEVRQLGNRSRRPDSLDRLGDSRTGSGGRRARVVPVDQRGAAAALEGSRDRRLRGCARRQGIDLDGWWDRRSRSALLGAVVQFGWEKALGDDDELEWWLERARLARPTSSDPVA